MNFERNSQQAFFGSSALLFAASAALTFRGGSVSAMGTILAPLGGMYRWAKRYRKDVSADVRLREGETG
jgi:hypothetical protein